MPTWTISAGCSTVAAGLLDPDHGLRVVTTTRKPFDFYVAEYERSRTCWAHELREPASWVHQTPGAADRVVDALTLGFDDWLAGAIGPQPGAHPGPRQINAGHLGGRRRAAHGVPRD